MRTEVFLLEEKSRKLLTVSSSAVPTVRIISADSSARAESERAVQTVKQNSIHFVIDKPRV
jgi:hypothetical protein